MKKTCAWKPANIIVVYLVNFFSLHCVGDFQSGVVEFQGAELALEFLQISHSPVFLSRVDGLQSGDVVKSDVSPRRLLIAIGTVVSRRLQPPGTNR